MSLSYTQQAVQKYLFDVDFFSCLIIIVFIQGLELSLFADQSWETGA